jgi:hypothetical protein
MTYATQGQAGAAGVSAPDKLQREVIELPCVVETVSINLASNWI